MCSHFLQAIEVEKNNIDEIFNAAKQLISNDTQTFKDQPEDLIKVLNLVLLNQTSKLGDLYISKPSHR